MERITLIGIDPGVVHTGIVAMHFDVQTLDLSVEHGAVDGTDVTAVGVIVKMQRQLHEGPTYTFIEAYRERGQVYSTNAQMRTMEQELRKAIPRARVLDNTGVKKVVTDDLMKLLGVWQFSTVTHHQDLRSAARIALYGALKDDELNHLITQIVMKRLGITTTTEKEKAHA